MPHLVFRQTFRNSRPESIPILRRVFFPPRPRCCCKTLPQALLLLPTKIGHVFVDEDTSERAADGWRVEVATAPKDVVSAVHVRKFDFQDARISTAMIDSCRFKNVIC